jgi:hypothetical protein
MLRRQNGGKSGHGDDPNPVDAGRVLALPNVALIDAFEAAWQQARLRNGGLVFT